MGVVKSTLLSRLSELQEYYLASHRKCDKPGYYVMSPASESFMVVATHFTQIQNAFCQQSASAPFVANS